MYINNPNKIRAQLGLHKATPPQLAVATEPSMPATSQALAALSLALSRRHQQQRAAVQDHLAALAGFIAQVQHLDEARQ